MSQTSDKSRTFRVLNLTDDAKTQLTALKATVTQHENINYVEVESVDDIEGVKSLLDSSDIKYKQCSYSTFVRFKEELTLEKLNTTTSELCANVNILYSRIDENNHTGKVVVDRLEDYNTLKNNNGDINFYRFSPVSVNVSSRPPRNQNGGGDGGGQWEVQRSRQPRVASSYVPQQAGQSARGGAGGRGRGAPRGRGGPPRGRPAPNSS